MLFFKCVLKVMQVVPIKFLPPMQGPSCADPVLLSLPGLGSVFPGTFKNWEVSFRGVKTVQDFTDCL